MGIVPAIEPDRAAPGERCEGAGRETLHARRPAGRGTAGADGRVGKVLKACGFQGFDGERGIARLVRAFQSQRGRDGGHVVCGEEAQRGADFLRLLRDRGAGIRMLERRDRRAAGFQDAGLVAGDLRDRVAEKGLMVEIDRRDDGNLILFNDI